MIMPMFEGRLFTNEELNRKVERCIRDNYAFTPSWEFTSESPDGRRENEILMPYPELDGMIADRLRTWCAKIEEGAGYGISGYEGPA